MHVLQTFFLVYELSFFFKFTYNRNHIGVQSVSFNTCIDFFLLNILFIVLEREEGRERNVNQLLLVHLQLGTWPATQACALTRNQTETFWFLGQCPTH